MASPFVFPDVSALVDDCAKATAGLETSIVPLKNASFVILDASIKKCDLINMADSYFNAADRYRDTQSSMETIGILGADYRFKNKAGIQLSYSAGFTKESLAIAEEVTPLLSKHQPPLPSDGSFYFPTLSAFFIKQQTETRTWYHVNSSKETPFVALVAITDVYLHLVPYSEQQRAAWDSLISDGKSYNAKVPTPLLLSPEMCAKLEDFSTAKFIMRAGQVVVVHRSMPISFEGVAVKESADDEEEEGAFLVKTVVLEQLRKTTQRKHLYARTLENKGVFASGAFNEDFPVAYLHKPADEEPVDLKLFTKLEPVPFFMPDAPTSVKPAVPVEGVPKMSNADDSSSSSSSSSSAAAAPVAKAPAVKPALLEQFKVYDDLVARIAKLDPRLWNERFIDNATEKYNKLQKDKATATGLVITQFKKVLETLAGKIASAEEDVAKLPPILEKLDQCAAMLKSWESLPKEAKDEIRRRNANQKKYDKYTAAGVCLVPLVKKVDSLLEKCLDLQKAVDERISKLGNKGSKRNHEEEAAAPVDVLDGIDPVDEDALEPDVRMDKEGDEGWQRVLLRVNRERPKFIVMAQAMAHPVVFSYLNRLEEEFMATTELLRTNKGVLPNGLDVSKMEAYLRVLDEIFHRNGAASKKVANGEEPTRVTSSKVKCGGCDSTRVNFDKSGFCRECYVENVLDPMMAAISNREDAARIQVKQEAREGKSKSELQLNYEKYTTIAEELVAACEALEKPNPKNLSEFKKLYAQADQLLPPAVAREDGSYEGEEEDEDDDDVEEDEEPLLSLPKDYKDPDEESCSPKKKSSSSKKRERTEDEDVAVLGMEVLSRFPVQSVHQKSLGLWRENKRERLRHYLEEIKETNVVWAVILTDLSDKEGTKSEHDCFVDKHVADLTAAQLREPGITNAEVVKREIVW
jgi:hypothetical protein